jgi:hypothetical protein
LMLDGELHGTLSYLVSCCLVSSTDLTYSMCSQNIKRVISATTMLTVEAIKLYDSNRRELADGTAIPEDGIERQIVLWLTASSTTLGADPLEQRT